MNAAGGVELDLVEQGFVIVTGFIDAKDDRGRTVYASLVAFASRRSIKFVSLLFSKDALDKELEWADLLSIHKTAMQTPGRDPSFLRFEEELREYIQTSNVLSSIAKNHNTKQAEQSISRQCLDHLQLKAVSFIDFSEASDSDFQYLDTVWNDDAKKPEDAPQSEETTEEDIRDKATESGAADIFIRCDPILDPVNGKAMSELRVGDHIYGRLPEDSVFYKLLLRNYGAFDGTITAKVTGVLINDLGTATVSLELSDGVAGVMKLSGKVKIRVVENAAQAGDAAAPRRRMFRLSDLSTEMVFAVAGSVILISALAVLYYVFR